MQILCEQGFEFKRTNGLKLINGQIKKLIIYLSYHMWVSKGFILKKDKLFSGIKQKTEFILLIHELKNYSLRYIIANVKYSNKSIVAAIKEKFLWCTISPRKSGEMG